MATTPKTPAIPSTGRLPREIRNVIDPMKEQLETVTGKRPKVDKLTKLSSTATLAQVITAYNELLDRLQS